MTWESGMRKALGVSTLHKQPWETEEIRVLNGGGAQKIGCPIQNNPENLHGSTIIESEGFVFRAFSLLIE